MTNFKPMLAASEQPNLDEIRYPVLVSPKLDGIRCTMVEGRALCRSLKPVPNKFVREWMEANVPNGYDGELMLPRREDGSLPDFNEVQSAIMSEDSEPNFEFHVFDAVVGEPLAGYEDRYLGFLFGKVEWPERMILVANTRVESAAALEDLTDKFLAQGFEGAIVRDPKGGYKFGRSTLKQGWMLKVKPFLDEEATVIGVEEMMRNQNLPAISELGRVKRSKAKVGLVATGMLGALLCRCDDGAEFSLGGGFTEKQRRWLWSAFRPRPGGQLSGVPYWPINARVIFKHQRPPGGVRKPGQAPRSPVFKAFRSPEDIS